MDAYDSGPETRKHIDQVAKNLSGFIRSIVNRQIHHDDSKLGQEEKPYFDKWTPLLSGVTYGSKEYRGMLDQMRPAIAHHHQVNRHHPEYFQAPWYPDWPLPGIECMTLVDLVEMLADWKAATMRHDDGDIKRSLKINEARQNIAPELVAILRNTLDAMGW